MITSPVILKRQSIPVAAEFGRHVETALKEVRALASGLVPTDVEPDLLGEALAALAESVSRSAGVHCRYHGPRDAAMEDAESANHLFRLAQEALQNAVGHAHARHIDICWQCEPTHIRLDICDDGTGMGRRERRPAGMGLHTMDYRADVIAGYLSIEAGDEGGTRVR